MGAKVESSYVPLDIAAAINEQGKLVQGGDTCHIEQLKNVFAWMRGFINGWYGWPNDGKSLMLDYLSVLKAKHSRWKSCMFKPENMDTIIDDKKRVHIKANRIYKNLAWTLTGKTWNKSFAIQHKCPLMTAQEEEEALFIISEFIYIIYPKDRKWNTFKEECLYMYEKFGIDNFVLDPWYTIKLDSGERDDYRLQQAFTEAKEVAMLTNSVFNIVGHPKNLTEVKNKDGSFKIVNQFMILGGSPWDTVMDGQYSIYRPKRHEPGKSNDPTVNFINLKQRDGEIVGVERGEYNNIFLERTMRQYYFDYVNPMNGSLHHSRVGKSQVIDFSQPKKEANVTDDLPF